MKTSIMKKSLLDYAIKGKLTAKFRRENPTLSAFNEIHAYNAQIAKTRKEKQKQLSNLEKTLKSKSPVIAEGNIKSPLPCGGGLGVGKIDKQAIKSKIQALKKEIAKLKEIQILNPHNTVIASERSERGNPQNNTQQIDCHDFASQNLAMTTTTRDCHESLRDSRNDKEATPCHTERSEVSKSKKVCHTELSQESEVSQKSINRDSSVASLPQNDKNKNTQYDNAHAFPFEIPPSWAWVKGKDIFIETENAKPQGEIFNYIDIDSIDNKNQKVKAPKILETKNASSRARRILQANDILFSIVRPYLKNIALIDENLADCIASTGFFVCRGAKVLYPHFLFYLMTSNYVVMGLNAFMKGDNSPSINKDDILDFLFPLPPLNEQKAIAQKLESLIALANEFEATQENLKRIEKRIEKSLLRYAIKGNISAKFRATNPSLNAFDEINAYNEQIAKTRKEKQKELQNLEKALKSKSSLRDLPKASRGNLNSCHTEGEARSISQNPQNRDISPTAQYDKLDKQTLKSQIQALKKEIAKLKEIQILNSPSLVSGDSESSPSLAEGDKGGGYKNTLNSKNAKFAKTNSTHPLAPSAREGESFPFEIPPSWAWVRLGDICEISSGESITPNNQPPVIARERSDRSNPEKYAQNIDCHESATFNKVADSRNDKEATPCHTERSEVSKSKKVCHTELSQESEVSQKSINRDSSVASLPQNDKNKNTQYDNENLNCHFERSEKSQYDKESAFPFEIPPSWAWVRLGDICEIILGKTPPRETRKYWDNPAYKWISISDMQERSVIEFTKESISEIARQECFKGNIFKKGTLIVSFKLSIGKTSFLGFDGFHNEGIASIIPKIHKENDEFFKKFLLEFLPYFTNLCETTGAIKGETLNKEKLENLLIPIPPKREQESIATQLDTLFSLSKGLRVE